MKKIAAALLCGALLSTASAGAEGVKGKDLSEWCDSLGIVQRISGRNCVSVRSILEGLGMDVDYDNGCVSASDGNNEVRMYINSKELSVNGESFKLDFSPFIEKGRAFVPLDTIKNALCLVSGNCDGSNMLPEPTAAPTAKPTAAPTAKPTAAPTAKPTAAPTAKPTAAPTAKPTAAPTAKPTAAPTAKPTAAPTAKPTAAPTAKPTASVASEREMEQQVLTLVNKVRAQYGLSQLTWAEDLAAVARAHSSDMIARSFFDHTNPDGKSPFDRLRAAGISYRTAAENIAYGQRNADEVMNAWMNSSGHRANILNANVKEMGVGAVKKSNGTIYWTQLFVAR